MSTSNLKNHSTHSASYDPKTNGQNFFHEIATFSNPEEEAQFDMLLNEKLSVSLSQNQQKNNNLSCDIWNPIKEISDILAKCSNNVKCLCHSQIEQVISRTYQDYPMSQCGFHKSNKANNMHPIIKNDGRTMVHSLMVQTGPESSSEKSSHSVCNKNNNVTCDHKDNVGELASNNFQNSSLIHDKNKNSRYRQSRLNTSEILFKEYCTTNKVKQKKQTNRDVLLKRSGNSDVPPKQRKKFMDCSAVSTSGWTVFKNGEQISRYFNGNLENISIEAGKGDTSF